MFVHAVYFSLREGLTEAERAQFIAGLHALRGIESVREGYIGVPAATDRPVIARDYSHALVLVFPDVEAHDAYQQHPVHDRFRDECSSYWTGVRIYDSVGDTNG